jgi:serine phosphatase RsbU (regulator of sigma subunit)
LSALLVLIPLAYLLRPLFWDPLDLRFYDFFQARWRSHPWNEVVVVGIDRATRTELLQRPVHPLSRHTGEHAAMIRALDQSGARAIVFDLSFSEDAFADPPSDLIDAIRSSGNVRLICYLDEQRVAGPHGTERRLVQVRLPQKDLVDASVGAFLTEAQLDRDGTLRRMVPDSRLRRLGYISLAEHLSGQRILRPVPIAFPGVDCPVPEISYKDLIAGTPEARAAVRGRIAFIGQVGDVLSDFVQVPVPQRLSDGNVARGLPGVAALAAMTETLFKGSPIRDAPSWLAFLWNVAWCVLAVLVSPRRRPWFAALVLAGITAGSLTIAGYLHSFLGYVLPGGLLFGCLFLTSANCLVAGHVETNRILHVEQAENERVRKELETARRTQVALLPKEIPSIPGLDVWGVNLSSLEVSGDYFDVVDSTTTGDLLLVIADVCGKGLPAAIIMSNVHAALHSSLGRDRLDPARIAEDLNRLLNAHIAAGKFVTFFIGAVEKETRRFRYVSAGHEPPLLLRRGHETRLLDVGGLPLGLFPGSSYRIGEEELEDGDLLCLYTDGVTEASNLKGEFFERERLAETLHAVLDRGAREVVEEIVRCVERFSGQKRQDDDVTLVVLRVGSLVPASPGDCASSSTGLG